jgi:hypothetical protein
LQAAVAVAHHAQAAVAQVVLELLHLSACLHLLL